MSSVSLAGTKKGISKQRTSVVSSAEKEKKPQNARRNLKPLTDLLVIFGCSPNAVERLVNMRLAPNTHRTAVHRFSVEMQLRRDQPPSVTGQKEARDQI